MTFVAEEPSAFEHWRKAVGLPEHFPRLDRVEFRAPPNATSDRSDDSVYDDLFFFAQPHEELIEAAYESLAQNAIGNLSPEGHGITTLARYVYHRSANHAYLRGLVPVWISLEDFLDVGGVSNASALSRYQWLLEHGGPLRNGEQEAREKRAREQFAAVTIERVEDGILDAIESAIVRSLLTQPWERIIGRPVYARLVGASTTAAQEIADRRRRLASFLPVEGSPKAIVELQDTPLKRPWTELMPDLYGKAGVRLSLQFDLSPSPIGRYFVEGEGERLTVAYEEALMNVAAALKNVRERAGTDGGLFLNRAFFISPAAWTTFESHVSGRVETTAIPAYSKLDLFTIFAVHFRRSTGGKQNRADELAAVLDSDLIPYDDKMALSTMATVLGSTLRALTREAVRFQLSGQNSGMWGVPRAERGLKNWQEGMEKKVDRIDISLRQLQSRVDGLEHHDDRQPD